MSAFHVVAALPNQGRKTVTNLSREQVAAHVAEFVRDGTLTTRFGNGDKTRQAYELKIYETPERYVRRTSGQFDSFVKGRRNRFRAFEREAMRRVERRRHRVFVVMPIQGDEYGTQSDRNVFLELSARFAVIESVLDEFDCVAIRIDREAPAGSLVDRIKAEIARAQFVIADLTDERPSCYFEAGYAEALGKTVIFVASNESAMQPGTPTKIHFDIHQNVQFFGNHDELAKKVRAVIEKNGSLLTTVPEWREMTWADLRALSAFRSG